MYEFFECEKRFYLVQEICKGGELFDEVQKRGKFTERDAAVLVKQILQCMNYCHSHNIIHRDLKPENVLIESTEECDQIKVIDWGTSVVTLPGKKEDRKIGTPFYMAPEVINKSYDNKSDIWSIGIITYILLCGKPPFFGTSEDEINQAVLNDELVFREDVWKSISGVAKAFIQKLIERDVDKRYSAAQALQDTWIQELAKNTVDEVTAISALKNLKNFKADQHMKIATLTFIASNMLPKAKKEDAAKVFKAFDISGSGRLSKEDV